MGLMRAEFSNGSVSCRPLKYRQPQGGRRDHGGRKLIPCWTSDGEEPRGHVTNLGLVRTNLVEVGDKAGLGTEETRKCQVTRLLYFRFVPFRGNSLNFAASNELGKIFV